MSKVDIGFAVMMVVGFFVAAGAANDCHYLALAGAIDMVACGAILGLKDWYERRQAF